MKKILYLAAVCIFLLSCTEDKMPSGMAFGKPSGRIETPETPSISASKTSLSFSADGGSQTITITANFSWETISVPDWITVSPTNGTNGSTSLTVKASKYTETTSSRTGTIAIGNSSKSVSVSVTQNAATVNDEISASVESLDFTADGGSQTITITANFSWETISKPSWITLSPTSGKSGNTSLTITVDKSTDTSERTGTITIGKSSSATTTISISQSGANVNYEITSDSTKLVFYVEGGSKVISITSNFAWETISKPTWITLTPTPTSGESGTTNVTVIAQRLRLRLEPRRGKIIFGDSLFATLSIEVEQLTESSKNNSDSETITVNGVSFKMIKVDGGTFTMGATEEQGSDAYGGEKPAHSVTLSDYYIGETEVTQELWEALMGSNPSEYKSAKKPVEKVSWDDCQTFIEKLNELTGRTFRLPTEAEWEYAARGGNNSQGYKYSGSDNIDEVAWYRVNSHDVGESSPDYGTHTVATKKANELGLYDMSGNVWEWCQDWDGDYSASSETNPKGPSSGSCRVGRGGSWYHNAGDCRVSRRNYFTPDFRVIILGLRLAL